MKLRTNHENQKEGNQSETLFFCSNSLTRQFVKYWFKDSVLLPVKKEADLERFWDSLANGWLDKNKNP
ncbi:MAG: hypothetical protein WBG90_18280 [Saonia sp.]